MRGDALHSSNFIHDRKIAQRYIYTQPSMHAYMYIVEYLRYVIVLRRVYSHICLYVIGVHGRVYTYVCTCVCA